MKYKVLYDIQDPVETLFRKNFSIDLTNEVYDQIQTRIIDFNELKLIK
jgi:hypothetical protein